MSHWACGIAGCRSLFSNPEDLVAHQVVDHEPCTCEICGETHPAGYLSIRHAFSAHTRAEYVRAYEASSDDIRLREQVCADIEEAVDVPTMLGQLGVDVDDAAVTAGD